MPKLVRDEEIFAAVIEVMLAHGYAGATTQQIAETAGINEVTLYRRFNSKAELVKATIAHEVQRSQVHSIRYTGDVHADLLEVVARYYGSVQARGDFMPMILSELPRHPELSDALVEPMTIMAVIGELMTRYQENGVLRKENSLHAVSGLLGPLIVIAMLRRADPDLSIPLPDLDAHVAAFLHGRQV